MTRTLLKFILPLFLLMSPFSRIHAQTGGSDNSSVTTSDQSQDDNSDDKKKKKKDDKKEDVKEDVDFFTISIDKFNPAFFARLGLDVLMMIVLIRFVYFPVFQRRDHLFTFF